MFLGESRAGEPCLTRGLYGLDYIRPSWACINKALRIMSAFYYCSLRLVVRTSPSHGGNTGSTPVGSAIFIKELEFASLVGISNLIVLIHLLFWYIYEFSHR